MEQESGHQPLQHLKYWWTQFSKAPVHTLRPFSIKKNHWLLRIPSVLGRDLGQYSGDRFLKLFHPQWWRQSSKTFCMHIFCPGDTHLGKVTAKWRENTFLALSNCIFSLIYRHMQLHHLTRPDPYVPGTTNGSQTISSLRVTLRRAPIPKYHPSLEVHSTQVRPQTVYFAGLPQPTVSLSEQGVFSRQSRSDNHEMKAMPWPPNTLFCWSKDWSPALPFQGCSFRALTKPWGIAVCRAHTLCFAFSPLSAGPGTMKRCISLQLHWDNPGKSRDTEHPRSLQPALHQE